MYHYIFIYRAILEPGLERLLQVSESILKTASDILYMYHYIFIYRAILEPGLERLLCPINKYIMIHVQYITGSFKYTF
jgi:hypothetical protein